MMRYAAGIYIADEPQAWTWAIDAIQDHVLAAEPHATGRRLKESIFQVLRQPGMRRLLPLRSTNDINLLQGVGDLHSCDLIFRCSHGKWISFRVSEGVLTRHFPSRWRW